MSRRTTEHPLRSAWRMMICRCTDPRNPAFKNYGARGIRVCDRWAQSFDAFLADMGERPEGLTLDRINNDGDYEPGNCRWATWEQQVASRRQARGEAQGTSKLTEASVFAMRRVYALGFFSYADLARWFSVSHSAVGKVIARQAWGHVP